MKIRKVIPATGNWYAVYKKGNNRVRYPVACWAIIEDWEEVDGIKQDFDFVRGMIPLQDFDTLIFPDEEGSPDEVFWGYERDDIFPTDYTRLTIN